ncbi:MAG: hypothetical protein KVP17_000919, partial [Porospora cf. gigantea B]|uniref:uncharacterized protein n=2 Tax=Porospora cf. gigantea B TaxID=2853592 RepID=UPI0035717A8D
SKDKFVTFEKVATYVVQYSWGDPDDQQHPTRIFFTHHTDKSGGQPMYGGWHNSVSFCSTDNFGSSVRRHVPGGNKFMVGDGFIFVAMSVDPSKQSVALMVSRDNGRSFRQARFPFSKYLMEKSYTILDTSGGAVMLHVNHGHGRDGGSATGNIYISDEQGLEYALSLPGNVRTAYGECEFDRVQGLEGIYIANFNDDPDEAEEDQVEEEDTSGNERKRGRSTQAIRTVITFDKGGVWSYLTPPKVDSLGKPIKCANPSRCFLHLHGISRFSMYAPFYSTENSPGIVMGTGNVGDKLTEHDNEVHTFISRDGGVTWAEAHKGAFIYEYADHGGLIAMVDDTKQTDQVVFSWNEGHSLFDFGLGSDAFSVDNVVTDPEFGGLEFLLYGTRGESGVLFHLDFAPLKHVACRNPHLADSVSSDYETWTPTDGRGSADAHCLLGVETKIVRRKQTSECFNGREFSRPKSQTVCQCTMEDYECMMGFTRDINSFECRPDRSGYAHPDCFSARLVDVEAYRKIPGDRCEGGWQPGRVLVMCHEMSPLSGGAKRAITVLLIGVLVVGALICINSNPYLRPYLGQFHRGSGEYGTVRPRKVAAGNVFTFYGPNEEPDLGFIEAEECKEAEIPQLMRFSPAAETIDQVAIGNSRVGRREVNRELL